MPRFEDGRLLRGEARFLDDIPSQDTVHVALLRSPVAHARLTTVDLSAARAQPGVVAAFAGADVARATEPFRVHLTTPGAIAPDRDLLASTKLRYVGEPVAAVVAESRYLAEDALEAVAFDYDPLPPVVDAEAALLPGAAQVHADVPGNVYFRGIRSFGDVEAAFAAAETVVRGVVRHPRVTAAPMEGRGVLARPDGEGVMVWSSTQCPHLVRTAIAECCRLPEESVRVISADVGGGFGLKAHVYPEEVLVPWIALQVGRNVKWVEDRSEHLQGASPARDQRIEFEAAVDGQGVVHGLRARILSSVGAYAIRPHGPLLDPMTTAGLVTGPYAIRNYSYETVAVATNKPPEGPYRGVGMVTAVLAHERLMDLVATTLALDPAEVRRRNFVPAGAMPYTAVTGHRYESGDFGATLAAALQRFDYEQARRLQAEARAQGRLVGVGLGSYVEFTGGGSGTFVGRGMVGIPGIDRARVWLDPEGRVRLQSTCPAIGQGTQTTLAQIVAAAIGVPVEAVVVEQTDTAKVGYGTGSFQSRSSVTGATSAHRAALQLKQEILEAAAWRLDEPAENLRLAAGRVEHASGVGPSLDLVTLAASAPEANGGLALNVEVVYDPVQASHPYATHACLAEIDPHTGGVTILRYVVGEDCGPVINPAIVDGQVHGGVLQGLAAALLEELTYSDEGQLLSGSFMDYLIPTSQEAPEVAIVHLVTPSTVHEIGTKGIGEGGTIGATAAVTNAILDALGAEAADLPLTPAKILAEVT